jgi:DNA invertase Pin-like site-specific DNA recombinase
LEEFRGIGIQFISYQENIETGTPLGQALFVIIAAIAELERGLLCERVTAGINHARLKGTRLNRPSRHVDIERVVGLQAEGMSLLSCPLRLVRASESTRV